MATPMLKGDLRNATGKNKMSKQRREGTVPGVVYSKGKDTQSIYLKAKEIEKLLSRYGTSSKIGLDLDGKKTFAIIKEVQKNMVKNTLLHVDLQTLDENEKIRLTVPIYLMNKEKVESSSEILQVQLNEVEIQTYPRYLPEKVEVDASKLKEQDNLTLEDLNIASDENIEILDDINSVVATIVHASKQEEEEEEESEELLEI
ncbi:LSU ribosomal protein L25P [Natronincola peptidivorans]|uniref:Large ribosomal subunit protein bL25 n=1 Tax=Natronincola peptidivorans TaxID=426128 RepID=A0A1I0GWG2_9FIRM|nr:50S ribosomal protein L25 [Natronincola peptidivorans]SET75502.1 LSU ribosomal protein L25P [Natronincola peptidivorans]